MHFAVIAPESLPAATEDPLYDRMVDIETCQALSALAIAHELSQSQSGQPCIFCSPNSLLAERAKNGSLPHIITRPGLFHSWKLWRWQRQIDHLAIAAMGDRGIRLGKQLLKMRHGKAPLYTIIFFKPDRHLASQAQPSSICLCGSGHIEEEIRAALEKNRKGTTPPEIRITAPGIDTRAYDCRPRKAHAGKRFIFGMAESLTPHSAALQVVRAMSALWQHDDVPPWEVRMFGAGDRFHEIIEEAEKLGVLPRLSLLSTQPLHEVACHCDAWLAPGADPDELPATLWAGFAAQVPVICSNSPLHLERLQADSGAIVINCDNPQELAKAMLELMRYPDMYNQCVDAGRNMLPFISLDGMAKRVCAIINPAATAP